MPSYVFSIQNSIYHIVENYGTYYINAGTMAKRRVHEVEKFCVTQSIMF